MEAITLGEMVGVSTCAVCPETEGLRKIKGALYCPDCAEIEVIILHELAS